MLVVVNSPTLSYFTHKSNYILQINKLYNPNRNLCAVSLKCVENLYSIESMVRLWILIYFEYYPTEVNSFFEKDAFDSIWSNATSSDRKKHCLWMLRFFCMTISIVFGSRHQDAHMSSMYTTRIKVNICVSICLFTRWRERIFEHLFLLHITG